MREMPETIISLRSLEAPFEERLLMYPFRTKPRFLITFELQVTKVLEIVSCK